MLIISSPKRVISKCRALFLYHYMLGDARASIGDALKHAV